MVGGPDVSDGARATSRCKAPGELERVSAGPRFQPERQPGVGVDDNVGQADPVGFSSWR